MPVTPLPPYWWRVWTLGRCFVGLSVERSWGLPEALPRLVQTVAYKQDGSVAFEWEYFRASLFPRVIVTTGRLPIIPPLPPV